MHFLCWSVCSDLLDGHCLHLGLFFNPFVRACSVSKLYLTVTLWTIARQAPPSMGFPRQEYWSELPFFYPGDLPDPGIKPMSLALAGRFFTTEPRGKSINGHIPQQICSCDGRIIFSLTSSLNSAPVLTQHGFMTSKMHDYSFVEGEL